jgi:hypothetical protein
MAARWAGVAGPPSTVMLKPEWVTLPVVVEPGGAPSFVVLLVLLCVTTVRPSLSVCVTTELELRCTVGMWCDPTTPSMKPKTITAAIANGAIQIERFSHSSRRIDQVSGRVRRRGAGAAAEDRVSD